MISLIVKMIATLYRLRRVMPLSNAITFIREVENHTGNWNIFETGSKARLFAQSNN